MAIKQALQAAESCIGKGQFSRAEVVCREILASSAEHPDALYFMGIIAHQQHRLEDAVALIGRAVAAAPAGVRYQNDLGVILAASQRFEEAIAVFERVLSLDPTKADTYSNLGNALGQLGRMDRAVLAYRRSLELRHGDHTVWHRLGHALRLVGRIEEAVSVCREATRICPQSGELFHALGLAEAARGHWAEAVSAYRRSTELQPNSCPTLNDLSDALRKWGQPELAIDSARRAVALNEAFADGHNTLGLAFQASGALDQAMACYLKAIALRPESGAAHLNAGTILQATGHLDEALIYAARASCDRAYQPEACNNQAQYLWELGRAAEAIDMAKRTLSLSPEFTIAQSNLLHMLHYHPAVDRETMFLEHRRWGRAHASSEPILPHANSRVPHRRLRIGYVSSDLREHPIACFLLPLLSGHDRGQFELTCYACTAFEDHVTDRFKERCDHWRCIAGISDKDAEGIIRRDEIDILVDLSLHTAGNRLLLFARKPAPVQISYLGYCGTTGLDKVDYRFSDARLDPPGQNDAYYSERTFWLPETYWCYAPTAIDETAALTIAAPPSESRGCVTFACLNNFTKVNDLVLELWSRVLLSVPDSQLLLHCPGGSARQYVTDFMGKRRIAEDRLHLVARVSRSKYFQQYNEIDIALDTYPYGGGTTTCDALWMGVPVVSLAGDRAMSRAGLSVLSTVGVPELTARSPENYVQLATNLANDLARRTQLRATLRQRMQASPLMDGVRFARNVEAAYRTMWRTWCATAVTRP